PARHRAGHLAHQRRRRRRRPLYTKSRERRAGRRDGGGRRGAPINAISARSVRIMNEIEPRQQLRAAVETLSDERAQTLLGWLRMMRRARPAAGPFDDALPQPRGESVGPLGDMLGIVAEQKSPG